MCDTTLLPGLEPLVQVAFLAPASRALEFQRLGTDLLDQLLTDDVDDGDGFAPLSAATAVARHRDVWALPPWGADGDDERARWIWEDLADQRRLRDLVLAFHLNHTGATGTQIAGQAGYKPSGLPAALKHLAMRCRRAQKRPLWEFNDGTYTMTPEAHRLFGAVLRDAVPGRAETAS